MTRRRLAIATLTLCLAIGVATVAQQRRSWRVEPLVATVVTPSIDFRCERISRGATAFEATIFRFSRDRVASRLVDVAEGQTLGEAARGATLAVNGGYFDASFAPLGLYRVDGRDVSPLLSRPPLSGVVTIDAGARLAIVARDATAAIATARSAFQAGPFLIDPGGELGVRGDDGKLAERTVLASGGESVIVIVTTPVTLGTLAACLHDRPDAFGVPRVDRALNLDGGPSAGYVVDLPGEARRVLPRGRIRSALTFVVDR